jgi:hypothetical protein
VPAFLQKKEKEQGLEVFAGGYSDFIQFLFC